MSIPVKRNRKWKSLVVANEKKIRKFPVRHNTHLSCLVASLPEMWKWLSALVSYAIWPPFPPLSYLFGLSTECVVTRSVSPGAGER